MKERLIGLIKTYILFVCIFILQKPLFILYYSSLYAGASWSRSFPGYLEWFTLDLSLAGYLTAIPGLLFIAVRLDTFQDAPQHLEWLLFLHCYFTRCHFHC